MNQLELIHALDPRVFERARRLSLAIELLQNGTSRREASGQIQRRFGVSQARAWYIVSMAHDLAGPVK